MPPTDGQKELMASVRRTAEVVFRADEMSWETDRDYPRRGLGLTAQMLGTAAGAFERALDYVQQRRRSTAN